MAIAVEKLLALKAFYLGHAAAVRPASRGDARAMATAAIDQLATLGDPVSVLRRAFYHLLRAEIARHGGDPVPDREAARLLCARIDSPLYRLFMDIEQATMTLKKARGIHVLHAEDEGIRRTRTHIVNRGSTALVLTQDLACAAIGVDQHALSERESRFLRKTTIRAMLARHGVRFPAEQS